MTTTRKPLPFPDDIHKEFAKRLRELRIKRGLSQVDLAALVTSVGIVIDRTAVARIEQAAIESESKLKPRKVSIDEALGFAWALKIRLSVLMPDYEKGFDNYEPVTRAHFDKTVKQLEANFYALATAIREVQIEQRSEART